MFLSFDARERFPAGTQHIIYCFERYDVTDLRLILGFTTFSHVFCLSEKPVCQKVCKQFHGLCRLVGEADN